VTRIAVTVTKNSVIMLDSLGLPPAIIKPVNAYAKPGTANIQSSKLAAKDQQNTLNNRPITVLLPQLTISIIALI
jgi:hypothetical protein